MNETDHRLRAPGRAATRVTLALLIFAILPLAACACPTIRYPSTIDMPLATPLSGDAHDVNVCVDDVCDIFMDVVPPVHAAMPDSNAELDISNEAIVYQSGQQIAAGEHNVSVTVSHQDGAVLEFSGSVSFQQIDRCQVDSTATIHLARP